MMFGVLAALATVVGTGVSIKKGRDATKSSAAANDAQLKINRLRNAQQKRLWMNDVRQALATTVIEGTAALGGGWESSRIQGTLQSERTQRDLGLKEYAQLDKLGGEYVAASNRASRQSFQSGVYGSVANTAGQLGGYDKISDWIKS